MALTKISRGLVSTNAYKNYIINGNFDIWQRGTSQTSNGYGSADRWMLGNNGTTKTASQQTFTVGQTTVPNNPKYFLRTVVSSVTGAANYAFTGQRIEDVTALAGKTVTLSFWAKADANKNIAIEFLQNFGTGGTPSNQVSTYATVLAISTIWQRYSITTTLPSVSGKTVGTNGDDRLDIRIWYDAGTDYDGRFTLGHQSGTFDVAQVQLEEGSSATNFEYRHPGEEFILCARYYFQHTVAVQGFRFNGWGAAYSASAVIHMIPLPNEMRVEPAVTINNWNAAGIGGTPTSFSSFTYNAAAIRAVYGGTFTAGLAGNVGVDVVASAEL